MKTHGHSNHCPWITGLLSPAVSRLSLCILGFQHFHCDVAKMVFSAFMFFRLVEPLWSVNLYLPLSLAQFQALYPQTLFCVTILLSFPCWFPKTGMSVFTGVPVKRLCLPQLGHFHQLDSEGMDSFLRYIHSASCLFRESF